MRNCYFRRFFIIIGLSLSGIALSGCSSSDPSSGTTTANNTTTLSLDQNNYALIASGETILTLTNSGKNTAQSVQIKGLPDAVTASDCSSITAGHHCQLILTNASTLANGAYPISIQGSNTNTVTASLQVSLPNITDLQGPEGANVTAITGTNTRLYLGTPGAGVFTASTLGSPLNWHSINTGLGNLVINALALVNSNLYAATKNGVFELVNSEGNWQKLSVNGLTKTDIQAIAADNTGDVFIIANHTLYKLATESSQWSTITARYLATPTMLSSSSNGYVVLSDGNHIYDWLNGAFSYMTPTNPSQKVTGIGIDNSNTIYYGIVNAFWEIIYTPSLTPPWAYTNLSFILHISGPITNFAIDANGDIFFSSSYNTIYSWNKSSQKWSQYNSSFSSPTITDLTTSTNTLYLATTNGVLAANGNNWIPENQGLTAQDTNALVFSNNTLFAGYSAAIPSDQNTAVLSANYQNQTWISGGSFSGSNLLNGVSHFALQGNSNNATLYVSTGQGLYTSPDNTLWSPVINPNAPPTTISTPPLLAEDTANPNLVLAYAGAPNPTLYGNNNGTWQAPLSLQGLSGTIALLYSLAGTTYLGGTNGLFQCTGNSCVHVSGSPDHETAITNQANNLYIASADNNNVCEMSGNACQPLTSSNLGYEINALLFIGNSLYAGTANGLYTWTPGAETWTQLGLSDVNINALTTDSAGNLYIGTVAGNYELPTIQ